MSFEPFNDETRGIGYDGLRKLMIEDTLLEESKSLEHTLLNCIKEIQDPAIKAVMIELVDNKNQLLRNAVHFGKNTRAIAVLLIQNIQFYNINLLEKDSKGRAVLDYALRGYKNELNFDVIQVLLDNKEQLQLSSFKEYVEPFIKKALQEKIVISTFEPSVYLRLKFIFEKNHPEKTFIKDGAEDKAFSLLLADMLSQDEISMSDLCDYIHEIVLASQGKSSQPSVKEGLFSKTILSVFVKKNAISPVDRIYPTLSNFIKKILAEYLRVYHSQLVHIENDQKTFIQGKYLNTDCKSSVNTSEVALARKLSKDQKDFEEVAPLFEIYLNAFKKYCMFMASNTFRQGRYKYFAAGELEAVSKRLEAFYASLDDRFALIDSMRQKQSVDDRQLIDSALLQKIIEANNKYHMDTMPDLSGFTPVEKTETVEETSMLNQSNEQVSQPKEPSYYSFPFYDPKRDQKTLDGETSEAISPTNRG